MPLRFAGWTLIHVHIAVALVVIAAWLAVTVALAADFGALASRCALATTTTDPGWVLFRSGYDSRRARVAATEDVMANRWRQLQRLIGAAGAVIALIALAHVITSA